jgi:hypothetical protein
MVFDPLGDIEFFDDLVTAELYAHELVEKYSAIEHVDLTVPEAVIVCRVVSMVALGKYPGAPALKRN